MPFEMEFVEQVLAASTPRFATTKSEVVAYFQEQHPRGWRKPLVAALAPITGMTEKNLQRRFDPSRLGNQPKRKAEQEQYKELGRQIGPIGFEAPEGGFEVTFVGQIRISNQCYPRSFIKRVSGADAQALVEAAQNDEADFMTMFRAYFDGDDVAEGYCADPEIIIEPWDSGSIEGRPRTAHKPRTAYAKR